MCKGFGTGCLTISRPVLGSIHTCDLLGVNYWGYYGLHCSVWGHSHLQYTQLLCEP